MTSMHTIHTNQVTHPPPTIIALSPGDAGLMVGIATTTWSLPAQGFASRYRCEFIRAAVALLKDEIKSAWWLSPPEGN